MANGNVNWQDIGWTGQASGSTGLQDLLGDFFADPAAQMKFFEDYDPSKEQAATEQMQLGQQQAQEQARGSMWKMFEEGRQGRAGFGGSGRARQTAMGGIHKGLAQGREQAQLGLQQDISGMREGYRDKVMGMVGQLLASGAEASGGQTTGYDTSIYGQGFDETTGACSPGYYMAGIDSGQQGCIPIGGDGNNESTYQEEWLTSTPEQECASKGGIWFDGVCNFAGGESGGGGSELDERGP